MQPQTLRVKIETDGEVLLRDLPVRAGDEVVIRLEPVAADRGGKFLRSRGILAGTIMGEIDPEAPACPEGDWETPLD